MGKRSKERHELPLAKAEDVEFAEDQADSEDREALRRAEKADRRAAEYEGT